MSNEYTSEERAYAIKARNDERAERARQTLLFFKSQQMGEAGPVGEEEVIDLLVDLRHLVDRWATMGDSFGNTDVAPFEQMLQSSENHYEAERDGDDFDEFPCQYEEHIQEYRDERTL